MTRSQERSEQEPADTQPDRRWQVLVVCLVAGFMTLLDVSIVNVALPSMQRGLNASPEELSWVVSGYALTFGLALVPCGRLGDDLGRGRMFLLALLTFTAASVLAGVAPFALWLVVARLLQGAAGGMLNPQVLGLLQREFRGRERGRAFGLFGAVIGLSTAIGPLLGGLIIQVAGQEQGWRWVFFVNLPIGLAGLLFARRVLPADSVSRRGSSLDLVGVLLLGLALVCLLMPLMGARQHSVTSWSIMAASPVLLALFVWWERSYQARGRAPLVRLQLLRVRSYAFGTGLGLLYFSGFTGIFFVLAVYFQRGLGYTALECGLALTPFAVGSAVASMFGGRIVHRFGRRLVLVGLVCALIGLLVTDVLLANRQGPGAGWATALPLLFAGVGSGLVISPNQTLTLSEVDVQHGGTAAGVQQTAQRVGSALGTAAASGLFFTALVRGSYDHAISVGLVASVVFVFAALLVCCAELLVQAREQRA